MPPKPRPTVLLVALLSLVAGCSAPEAPPEPTTSTPPAGTTPAPTPPARPPPDCGTLDDSRVAGRSAPPLALYLHPPAEAARLVADVLGLALEGATERALDNGTEWRTPHGYVAVWGRNPIQAIHFGLDVAWPPLDDLEQRREVHSLFERMGMPIDLAVDLDSESDPDARDWQQVTAYQSYRGFRFPQSFLWVDRYAHQPVPGTYDGWATAGQIRPAYDLRHVDPLVAPEEAEEIARTYVHCRLAPVESVAWSGPDVRNESLVHRVGVVRAAEDAAPPAPGAEEVAACARGLEVFVDALTAAVVAWERPACL